MSTNPKPSTYNRQPVYDGYLSVELPGKDNAALWSAVIKPGGFPWNGVPEDLANRFPIPHDVLGQDLATVASNGGALTTVSRIVDGFRCFLRDERDENQGRDGICPPRVKDTVCQQSC